MIVLGLPSISFQIKAITYFRDKSCLILTIVLLDNNEVFKLCTKTNVITSTEHQLSINFATFDLWSIKMRPKIYQSKCRLLHLTGEVIDNIEISNELSTLSFQVVRETRTDPRIVLPLRVMINLSSRYFRINNLNILASIVLEE